MLHLLDGSKHVRADIRRGGYRLAIWIDTLRQDALGNRERPEAL
jgi:hypothetical protein